MLLPLTIEKMYKMPMLDPQMCRHRCNHSIMHVCCHKIIYIWPLIFIKNQNKQRQTQMFTFFLKNVTPNTPNINNQANIKLKIGVSSINDAAIL